MEAEAMGTIENSDEEEFERLRRKSLKNCYVNLEKKEVKS
jgi:hypothetical protein